MACLSRRCWLSRPGPGLSLPAPVPSVASSRGASGLMLMAPLERTRAPEWSCLLVLPASADPAVVQLLLLTGGSSRREEERK